MAEGISGPGFYPQPNEWTCGPFALKHALLALGRMVDVNQIASDRAHALVVGHRRDPARPRGARFECDLVLERRSDPSKRASCSSSTCASRRRSCCASTSGRTGSRSCAPRTAGSWSSTRNDDPLLSVRTWPQLRNWWRYHDTDYSKDEPAGPLRPDGGHAAVPHHGQGRLLRRAREVPAPAREPPARAPLERVPRGSARDLQAAVGAHRASRCRWASSCAATPSC